MKKNILLVLLLALSTLPLTAQSNLTVDVQDTVYVLIEMAEMKGLISRVSQVRPFPVSRIRGYLEEIDNSRGKLSVGEQAVLDEQRQRFGLIEEKEEKAWWETGRFEFGGQGTDMENFPMTLRAEIENFTNAEFQGLDLQNVTIFTGALQGDASQYISYDFNLGFGASLMNPDAFAPFSHKTYNDGFALALSGGLKNSLSYEGFAVTFHFMPEVQAQFLKDRLRIGMGRYSRSLGPGSDGLMISSTGRPYDALELEARPAKWLNYHFSVGSMGDWFSMAEWIGNANASYPAPPNYDAAIDEKNLTLQVVEVMPWDWMYLSLSTGSIWGKRSELSYFNPFMPLLFAQNLYGDADNLSMEMTGHFILPWGIKLYGAFYADEVQFNDLGTLFTKTSQQFALQAGIKGVIPGLGFTTGAFQYTKLEPYVYTHYQQIYPHSAALVDTSWTNDRYNLGYYLPPNSDEFLVEMESMPIPGLTVRGAYRFIRHGYGDWYNGEIEGTVTSGGSPAARHAYMGRTKNFLHDGPYEKIHMISLSGEYRFLKAPVSLSLDYTFSLAKNGGLQEDRNPGNVNEYSVYIPYSGIENALSLILRVYPEY